MQITTKFNLGQEVWFALILKEGEKPEEVKYINAIITGIVIKVSSLGGVEAYQLNDEKDFYIGGLYATKEEAVIGDKEIVIAKVI